MWYYCIISELRTVWQISNPISKELEAHDFSRVSVHVINHYKDIKDMFTLTLDSIMNRLNLTDNTKSASKNIFDILAEEINNKLTDKAS